MEAAQLSSGTASAHLEDARNVTSRMVILGPDGWASFVRAGSAHLPGMPRIRGRRRKARKSHPGDLRAEPTVPAIPTVNS